MSVKEFAEFSRAEVNASYSDLFSRVRGPVSIQNEFHVLRALSSICRMRLASYERSIGENVEILKDESLPMFSNQRNIVALVGVEEVCNEQMRSEQQVLVHYLLLFEAAKKYIEMPVKQQINQIEGLLDRQLSIYDYFQLVWLCALDKVWDLDEKVVIEEDPFEQEMERYLCRLNQRGKLTIEEVLREWSVCD